MNLNSRMGSKDQTVPPAKTADLIYDGTVWMFGRAREPSNRAVDHLIWGEINYRPN
jgi:hypothetical protein